MADWQTVDTAPEDTVLQLAYGFAETGCCVSAGYRDRGGRWWVASPDEPMPGWNPQHPDFWAPLLPAPILGLKPIRKRRGI